MIFPAWLLLVVVLGASVVAVVARATGSVVPAEIGMLALLVWVLARVFFGG